jgi:alpha-ketoglutarate-dependent taurine dioxygenase
MTAFGKIYEGKTYQDIWDNSESLYQELLMHKVLVFRGIETDFDSQLKLMEHFYPNFNHLRYLRDVDHKPLFDLFESQGLPVPNSTEQFARWHIDDSWLEEVADIDCLHMFKLDKSVTGGQTRWVDLEKIYTLLDETTINFIKNIKVALQWCADNINDPIYRRTHPETGNTSVYYPGLTTIGKDQDKWSDYTYLLLRLFEEQDNIFSLDWKENDLVIWDNRCTAHSLMGGFEIGTRMFNKIEIGKSKPYYGG